MNTWMKILEVRVDDKVIKLREERQLLARFLITQQTRKLDLRNTIGNFEMSLIPRALFNNDYSLLIPLNKSSLLTLIEEIPTVEGTVPDDNERGEASISVNNPSINVENDESFIQIGENDESHNWIARIEYPNPDSMKVFIIDAMAVVQTIKKTPTMKKMSDFCKVFCKKIQRLAKHYDEARVVFDEYFDNSLKEKTRAKRAAPKKGKGTKRPKVQINYRVNENMSLVGVTLKEMLGSTKLRGP